MIIFSVLCFVLIIGTGFILVEKLKKDADNEPR